MAASNHENAGHAISEEGIVAARRRGERPTRDHGPTGSSVVINVADVEEVTPLYRDVLGLHVRKSWDAPAGRGIIFQLGPDSTLEFVGPPHAERKDKNQAQGIEVMIGVDDAAEWLSRLMAAGVTIEREMVENAWGDRSFGIDDPSGMRVWIYEVL